MGGPVRVGQLKGRKRTQGNLQEKRGGHLSWLNPTSAYLNHGDREEDWLISGLHAWLEDRPGFLLPTGSLVPLM